MRFYSTGDVTETFSFMCRKQMRYASKYTHDPLLDALRREIEREKEREGEHMDLIK